MKPGRPLALGLWGGVPVFGLPGNPVAALVCALIFARPALSVMAGGAWTEPQGFDVPAAFAKAKKPGRREYLRARLTAGGRRRGVQIRRFGPDLRAQLGHWPGRDWRRTRRTIRPGDPVRYLPYSGFGI